jgi:dTDP-D-glucose 4,6-dehydratase
MLTQLNFSTKSSGKGGFGSRNRLVPKNLSAWRVHLQFICGQPQPNITTARAILKQLGTSESLIDYVADRLSHDQRYSVDSARIRAELAWLARISFQEGLQLTTDWYLNNKGWLNQARSTEYLQYYVRRSETLRKFDC